jgi:hypothetical protein
MFTKRQNGDGENEEKYTAAAGISKPELCAARVHNAEAKRGRCVEKRYVCERTAGVTTANRVLPIASHLYTRKRRRRGSRTETVAD